MKDMMKKMLAWACVLTLGASLLSGCGGNNNSQVSSEPIDSVEESSEDENSVEESSVEESSVEESSVEESSVEEEKDPSWHLYGTMTIENHEVAEGYEGTVVLENGEWDVSGILAKDAKTGRYFVEFYKDANESDIVLSYWVDMSEDMVAPVIGAKDAWILNMYLIEEEGSLFAFSTQTRKVSLVYPYNDGDEKCEVTITFRLSAEALN